MTYPDFHDDQLSPISGFGPAPHPNDPPILGGDRRATSVEQVEAALRIAAEQRAQLALPPGNADAAGRPHFLRNIDGVEVCGQDGKPWPCPSWTGMEKATFTQQTSGPLNVNIYSDSVPEPAYISSEDTPGPVDVLGVMSAEATRRGIPLDALMDQLKYQASIARPQD